MVARKKLLNTLRAIVLVTLWIASFIIYDFYSQERVGKRLFRIIEKANRK